MKQVKTSNGQLSLDIAPELQVKTTDNKVVTQTSLFDLIG